MAWRELTLGNWAVAFTSVILASIKYISPSEMDGTQLLAVYDVALGSCLDLYEKDYSLNNEPSAYDSVLGVCKTAGISSDFEPAVGMEPEQDNHEPITMLFTARELCITKYKSFKSCKNWSSGQIGKSCPSGRCLYQGKDNRLSSTDLPFVDLKLLSMENTSLERPKWKRKAIAVDGCSCAAVHTLHKEIERDSFEKTDKTG